MNPDVCSICWGSDTTAEDPIVKMCDFGHLGHRECVRLHYQANKSNFRCPFNDNKNIITQNIFSPLEIFKDRMALMADCTKSCAKFTYKEFVPSVIDILNLPYCMMVTTEENRIWAEKAKQRIDQAEEQGDAPNPRDLVTFLTYWDALEKYEKTVEKLPSQCAFTASAIYCLLN